jgi:hypothetical protein
LVKSGLGGTEVGGGEGDFGSAVELDGLMRRCVGKVPSFVGGCRRKKLKIGDEVELEMRRAKRRRMKGGSREDLKAVIFSYRSSLVSTWNEGLAKEVNALEDPEVFIITRRRHHAYRIPPLTGKPGLETFEKTVAALVGCLGPFSAPQSSWPEGHVNRVTKPELAKAVSCAPNSSAAGPDMVPGKLLKVLHRTHPDTHCSLFIEILQTGIHPET